MICIGSAEKYFVFFYYYLDLTVNENGMLTLNLMALLRNNERMQRESAIV